MIPTELRRLFDDPPRRFSPTPLWWWSGGTVTTERIRWQMERFAAGGVHNLVVINLAPAGPIVSARPDDPAWFSDAWWDRFRDTCAIAQTLDMKIWFYDQIGFSGANVQGAVTRDHPEAAGRALRRHHTALERGRVVVPDGQRLVAAYDAGGVRLDLVDDLAPSLPDGSQVTAVTEVPTAFDYLNPHAVDLLIDRVHGEFDRHVPEYFGTVVAGSFQDELPPINSWTAGFPGEFTKRRGYDLRDHLPLLFERSGATAAKVRGDYWAIRSELAEEALFRPLAEWHTARGLLIGCDQSNPARAGNPTQATQLYGDYFRTHRWYSAAGSDHEGDAKVHSSMAHLYGHERVWIEAFHSSGWGSTLEETYGWLLPFLRSGANLYNPHASYFDTVAGWFEWAPPSTDWRQPYWRHYPLFARAVSRISAVMSWGTFLADVAVLHPTATAQAMLTLEAPVDHFGTGLLGEGYADLDRTQDHYLALNGANNWFAGRVGVLDGAGVSYDVIDDASLQSANTSAGAVAVRDQRYRTVVLPSASVLEEATARALADFVGNGGFLVVVGRPPETAAGLDGDDATVAGLADLPGVVKVRRPEDVVDVLPTPHSYARSDVPLLVRRDGEAVVALVTAAAPRARTTRSRTDTRPRDDVELDPVRYRHDHEITVAALVERAELWDPASGEVRPCPVERLENESSRISVDLAGSPAGIVVWTEGRIGARADRFEPRSEPVGAVVPLDDGWTGELVPTLDNTWGDLGGAGDALTDLEVWVMPWREGAGGEWQESRVTHGQRAAYRGPCPRHEAPAALTRDEVERVLAGDQELAPAGWPRHRWSRSRGIAKDPGLLGGKGYVPEEFVHVPAPDEDQVVVVRAIVATRRPGAADLVLGAGAARRVWWNGQEVTQGPEYATVARVTARDVNVLEYHLAGSENARPPDPVEQPPWLGSFFTLVAPDSWGPRPAWMRIADEPALGGVSYVGTISVASREESSRLTVGAATGVTVLLDGQVVARQEKVEYYESSWGATPMFFTHDVTGRFGPGEHEVRIVTDSVDARDVVFVDLVVEHSGGISELVSGPGWTTRTGPRSGRSIEHRGQWTELLPAHLATRTHPLREAEWLNGPVQVGAPADPWSCSDSTVPQRQCYQVPLPAGTVSAQLPLRVPATVTAYGDGGPLRTARHDHQVFFDEPPAAPLVVEVTTEPVAFERGGAAWSGPVKVRSSPAPVALGSWRDQHLRSWSGGLRYRRRIVLPRAARVVLDLGRVLGTVEVELDGGAVGSAFCSPYRFELSAAPGVHELAVTVFNTLGPYLEDATPTTWVFPSQRDSGLFGPVRLLVHGTGHHLDEEARL